MSKAHSEGERVCLTTRLSEQFHQDVRVEAAKRDMSMSELAREALRNEVSES